MGNAPLTLQVARWTAVCFLRRADRMMISGACILGPFLTVTYQGFGVPRVCLVAVAIVCDGDEPPFFEGASVSEDQLAIFFILDGCVLSTEWTLSRCACRRWD